jgi:hypothetical protein
MPFPQGSSWDRNSCALVWSGREPLWRSHCNGREGRHDCRAIDQIRMAASGTRIHVCPAKSSVRAANLFYRMDLRQLSDRPGSALEMLPNRRGLSHFQVLLRMSAVCASRRWIGRGANSAPPRRLSPRKRNHLRTGSESRHSYLQSLDDCIARTREPVTKSISAGLRRERCQVPGPSHCSERSAMNALFYGLKSDGFGLRGPVGRRGFVELCIETKTQVPPVTVHIRGDRILGLWRRPFPHIHPGRTA